MSNIVVIEKIGTKCEKSFQRHPKRILTLNILFKAVFFLVEDVWNFFLKSNWNFIIYVSSNFFFDTKFIIYVYTYINLISN